MKIIASVNHHHREANREEVTVIDAHFLEKVFQKHADKKEQVTRVKSESKVTEKSSSPQERHMQMKRTRN